MRRTIRRINRLTKLLLGTSGTVLALLNLISFIEPLPDQLRITVANLVWILALLGRRGLLRRWGL